MPRSSPKTKNCLVDRSVANLSGPVASDNNASYCSVTEFFSDRTPYSFEIGISDRRRYPTSLFDLALN